MDPKLEQDLNEIMRGAQVEIVAAHAKQDIDLLVMTEVMGCVGVKSVVLTRALTKGPDYVASVLTGVVLKTRGMARAILENPTAPLDEGLLPADEDEPAGHQRAHEFVLALLHCGERADASHTGQLMADVMKALDAEQAGRMALHMIELSVALFEKATELKEGQRAQLEGRLNEVMNKEKAEELGLTMEGEGDS